MKYGDVVTAPLLRRAVGDPVFVTAAEIAGQAGADPVVRMLPSGINDHDRALMTDQATGLDQETDLGVPIGVDRVRVVIQAKDASLLLTGLRLIVDHRQTPLAGTLLYVGTQGGGQVIQVKFNADDPQASTSHGAPALNIEGHNYFDGDNYELDPGQSVEFKVLIDERRYDSLSHLMVDATLDGATYSVPVHRTDGSDFEITSATSAMHHVYELPISATSPEGTSGSIGEWRSVSPTRFCSVAGNPCDPAAWPAP